MSFTTKVKDEILQSKLTQEASRSIISSIVHSLGSISMDSFGLGFEISSESKPLITRTVKLIKQLYKEDEKITSSSTISPNKKNVYIAKYKGAGGSELLENLCIIDLSQSLEINFGIDEKLFLSEEDEKAYIIGAFLACGSVSIPKPNSKSGYHLEFSFSNSIMADDFASLLLRSGFNPKFGSRKGRFLTYFKDKESVSDMLAFMEASNGVLALSEIVIERETRNTANRQRNCVMANIDKAIIASEKHINAINKIDNKIGLDSLDEKLSSVAKLRRNNPSSLLEELGEMMTPPLTKSGINHRLRKIMKIAEEMDD